MQSEISSSGKVHFSNRQLWNMILPLVAERLMLLLVGMVDSVIISYAGETAVSGVCLVHNAFNTVISPAAMALGAGLRAAGDVKFTMGTVVFSSVVVRLVLSQILGVQMGLGLLGVTLAMVCDWIFRAVLYLWRLHSGKWQRFAVI